MKTPAANASSSGARSRRARSAAAAIPKPQMSDCAADKSTSASKPAASGSGVKRTITSGTKRSPMICATVPQRTARPNARRAFAAELTASASSAYETMMPG